MKSGTPVVRFGQDSLPGRFLKGLIKLSAAGVKVRENSVHGVRRHAASAGEVFADVAAESECEIFCGLEFTALQFAADRGPVDLQTRRPFFRSPTDLPLRPATDPHALRLICFALMTSLKYSALIPLH